MVMVVAVVIRNHVVASEIDSVSAGNLEENTLVLSNGDIKRLLEVL
jgi:hypothetical protein